MAPGLVNFAVAHYGYLAGKYLQGHDRDQYS
jgi:hypothetical protein